MSLADSPAATLSTHLRARYGGDGETGLDTLLASTQADAVLHTLLAHRSVRAYLPDPLPPGTVELLVAAAQSAPTSSNLQAWSLVAVEDPARKARLAVLARDQRHIHESPLFLVWIADLSRLRRVASTLGETSAALDTSESLVLAVIDAALAAQNAVVAAESLGLGTVYIGALRNEPEKVAAELRLPSGAFPLFGLVVGRPDPARPAAVKPRLPLSVVLHRETYDSATEPEAITAYDRVLADFQKEQNPPAVGWSPQASARVRDLAALGPRARLAEALSALGFTLEP